MAGSDRSLLLHFSLGCISTIFHPHLILHKPTNLGNIERLTSLQALLDIIWMDNKHLTPSHRTKLRFGLTGVDLGSQVHVIFRSYPACDTFCTTLVIQAMANNSIGTV